MLINQIMLFRSLHLVRNIEGFAELACAITYGINMANIINIKKVIFDEIYDTILNFQCRLFFIHTYIGPPSNSGLQDPFSFSILHMIP